MEKLLQDPRFLGVFLAYTPYLFLLAFFFRKITYRFFLIVAFVIIAAFMWVYFEKIADIYTVADSIILRNFSASTISLIIFEAGVQFFASKFQK